MLTQLNKEEEIAKAMQTIMFSTTPGLYMPLSRCFPALYFFFSFHEQEYETCQNMLWAHLSPVQLPAVPQGQAFLICWCLSSEKLPVGEGVLLNKPNHPKPHR